MKMVFLFSSSMYIFACYLHLIQIFIVKSSPTNSVLPVGLIHHNFILELLRCVIYEWANALLSFYARHRQFRLSICLLRAGIVLRWMKRKKRITRSSLWGSTNTLVFWYQHGWGRRPLPPKICGQSDPSTPSEKRRLRPIYAYNVSTARASEKCSITANMKSITRFPTSYRWSAYVTSNSPKGVSKSEFVVFVNKIQVQSNKVCYKVSLCENF